MPSRWTTIDELHVQFEALALVRAAIKVLVEADRDKSLVASEVADRSIEMMSVLRDVHNHEDFKHVSMHMFDAIDKAPRPTTGVFGDVE